MRNKTLPVMLRRLILTAVAASLVLAPVSCNKTPTSPANGPGSNVRLELTVPAEIAPGESVQLTVNVVRNGVSTENVTSRVQWTTTNGDILQISATGQATGRERGETMVTAHLEGRSATARVFVLPKGTFRLAGRIRYNDAGVAESTVTVIDGMGEGLTAVSGWDGSYALYGVAGSMRVSVQRSGYLENTQQLDVSAHRSQDFELTPTRLGDYAGNYRLTITGSCPAGLPERASRRVYDARVVQSGDRLTVHLTGAEFILVPDSWVDYFSAKVGPGDVIELFLGDWYALFGPYGIAERSGDRALVVNGYGSVTGRPDAISGTPQGVFMSVSASLDPSGPAVVCRFERFEMIRR